MSVGYATKKASCDSGLKLMITWRKRKKPLEKKNLERAENFGTDVEMRREKGLHVQLSK